MLTIHWGAIDFYGVAWGFLLYEVCGAVPGLILAALLARRPQAFWILAAAGIAGLLVASPMILNYIEWIMVVSILIPAVLFVLHGCALRYALRHHQPYWQYCITLPLGILLACDIVTHGLYPEPVIYFYYYLLIGVPAGAIAAIATVTAVKAIGR